MSNETEQNDLPPAPSLPLATAQMVAEWLFALADDYDSDAELHDEDDEDEAADESRAMGAAVRAAGVKFLRKATA